MPDAPNLPNRPNLEEIAASWGVTLEGPPIVTPRSVVRFGRRGSEAVALKSIEPGSDEALGAVALKHFAGRGAVPVLEANRQAVLMPRLLPGYDLTGQGDDLATHIFCDLAARLHTAGPAPEGFPSIADWGKGLQRHRDSDAGGIPDGLLADAERLFSELINSQSASVLLHGDLQHYNILRDDRLGWTVIDPKGVIGEPAYEVGAFLRNPDDRALDANRQVLDRRLDILAERLGHDRERMLAWHFAQAVLSAIWSIEDNEDPSGALATADTARRLLQV